MKTKLLFAVAVLILAQLFQACKKADDTVTPTTTNPGNPNPNQNSGFTEVPTVQDMVVYEVNLRAFSSAGTLNAVTERLDSIKKLGVNVLWLMPIQSQGVLRGINSPYCIKDYKSVNPEYGTIEDLKRLVQEAHNRKIAVLMDWVANHTSWDNAWINNRDWYTQVGGQIVIPPGTNWNDVADLNFDNNSMRQAMIEAMKFWVLEAKVDGYRCDAADMVPFSFWKQAIDSLRATPNRQLIMLAEGSRADHFTAGFNLNFGWDHFARLKEAFRSGTAASVIYSTHVTESSGINSQQARLRFTTNHDESAWDDTPIVLFGGQSGALSAYTIACFSGGVPLLYSSQEVGRLQKVPFFTKSPINWQDNPLTLSQYKAMMSVYRSAAKWRQRTMSYVGNANVWAVRKVDNTDTCFVIANTKNTNQKLRVKTRKQVRLSNEAVNWQGDSISLRPYQYVLLD